jgi:thimet oligopeptidase
MRFVPLLVLICLAAGCRTAERAAVPPAPVPKGLADFQARAARFHSVLSLPDFETTPAAIHESVSNTIARANVWLDVVGEQDPARATFGSTVKILDDVFYQANLTGNRLGLIKETSTNAALRDAATEGIKVFQEWAVSLDYREDVYAVVKAAAAKNPTLTGEDAKLFAETLRDYRRAGLELPKDQRAEVERLRKELTRLVTDFDSNITKARAPVKFTRAELDGVPEDFLNLKGIKTGEDEFTVLANVTFHYTTVMENARREDTRRKLETARDQLAMAENVPLLQRILALRQRIAQQLGYASWADFQVEPKMAKTAAAAREFCQNLTRGLQPKFDAELREFAALKAKDTGDPNAQIHLWDWRYYHNRLKKEKFAVDSEQLRAFFPYDKVLYGMFAIYQHVFGIVIEKVEPPYQWADDLQLYAVADAATAEPLGLLYLDMFPREGKYNHFAQFGLIEGKRLAGGKYQRPTVALICNFPTPQPDKPSLLTHRDVETLFHEFGHALHSIFTRANYARFSGTSVPRDFVEAPSQMLENWVWDKRVLDSFAAHYADPSRKIPQEILSQLKAADLATKGTFYRRQMSFALMDLALHTDPKAAADPVKLSNQVLGDVFLPMPEGTAFIAYFGHITGYDAAYYGYGWADAIAADLATVFEKAPHGYFDADAGRRLRREIYEPGDSRDVTVSIQKFLGRAQSLEPFLKTLGLGANADTRGR